MHSRDYLQAAHFRFCNASGELSLTEVIPNWSALDRVVIVAPDPVHDLMATAGLVLALTHAFYDRPAAREPGFYDYPAHFVIGGETGAEPRILGPRGDRPWSAAWCRLDVWPSTHHAISDPSPEAMLQAAFMLEPTRLLWPERLAFPRRYQMPAGPGHEQVQALFRNRLHQVLCYSQMAENPAPPSWSLAVSGSTADLVAESIRILNQSCSISSQEAVQVVFRSLPVGSLP